MPESASEKWIVAIAAALLAPQPAILTDSLMES
jgi:hypothetical protein